MYNTDTSFITSSCNWWDLPYKVNWSSTKSPTIWAQNPTPPIHTHSAALRFITRLSHSSTVHRTGARETHQQKKPKPLHLSLFYCFTCFQRLWPVSAWRRGMRVDQRQSTMGEMPQNITCRTPHKKVFNIIGAEQSSMEWNSWSWILGHEIARITFLPLLKMNVNQFALPNLYEFQFFIFR